MYRRGLNKRDGYLQSKEEGEEDEDEDDSDDIATDAILIIEWDMAAIQAHTNLHPDHTREVLLNTLIANQG